MPKILFNTVATVCALTAVYAAGVVIETGAKFVWSKI